MVKFKGIADYAMLFVGHKEFDKCFTEKDILHPVVLLFDCHSSRFDYEVLSFLQSKNICLFFTVPDTTAVTWLLDQLNKNIHHGDQEFKDNFFTSVQIVNKEAFIID